MRWLLPLLLLVAPAQTAPLKLEFGSFVITVSDSWTAQVFHIVDQLSQWDQYAHKAYWRWARTNMPLDAEDKRLLELHATMRKARGWGNGFEQAFLVDGSIVSAADQAVQRKLLTAEEASSERDILLHFAPKLEKLRDQHQHEIESFQAKLQSEHARLAVWFDKLIRFTQTASTVSAPVFLVVNSEEKSGGGEANRGRIVVEVPSPQPVEVLFHESLHVLLASHAGEIKAAAERAAVIRPVLRASIDAGETFSDFLPKAVARWREFRVRARSSCATLEARTLIAR